MRRHYSYDDCLHDEVKASTTCFWDDLPGTVLVNGAYLCESHAMCSTCLKSLANVTAPTSCICDDYDYAGHEELLWCSLDCMEAAHPDTGDLVEQEEEENQEGTHD